MRVGIDSYSLQPLKLGYLGVLDWTASHGGDGVQFTDAPKDLGLAREIAEHARSLNLYLEWGGIPYIPFDLATGEPRDIQGEILETAKIASTVGAPIIRGCSGGFMRWDPALPSTEYYLSGVIELFRLILPKLEDLGVTIAIETHFEFTTFEIIRVFDELGVRPGGPLGICLDTMNLMVMLEHPLRGIERVLPWIVATHAKDGVLIPSPDGFACFTAEAGLGLMPWAEIGARLRTLAWPVNLSLEDHGGQFDIPWLKPEFASRFPDLSVSEIGLLSRLAQKGSEMVRDATAYPCPRDKWPEACEERVARGITRLKSLLG